MSDNVVDITARFTEAPPVEVRREGYDDCRHAHTIVDARLRTVACADCREERLDPMEVLIGLASDWRRWKREAEKLTELRRDYDRTEAEKWQRRRDRHVGANPTHTVNPLTTGWPHGGCPQCQSLEITAPQSVKRDLRSDAAFDRRKLDPEPA